MNLVSLMLLLSAVANLSLAGYLFSRRHSRPVHFAFAFLVFPSTMWTLTIFALSCTPPLPLHLAVIWGRAAFATAAVAGLSCLVFSWHFPEKGHPAPPRWTVITALLAFAFVFAISLTPLVQADVAYEPALGIKPIFGPLHPLYVVYMVAIFTAGVGNLLKSRLRTPSGRERMQLNYCLTGVVLSFVPAFISTFVLPFFTRNSTYYMLGGASPLFWTWFTSYAIYRHRLMDIGIAFRNVLIHGLHALVLVLVVSVPFFVHYYLLRGTYFENEWLIILATAGLFALLLPGLQQRITHFVDHRIFAGRYDHETALVQFGDRLLRLYGRERITRMAAREITIIMQADGCAIYLPTPQTGNYTLFAAEDSRTDRKPEFIPGDHPLIAAAAKRRTPLAKGDLTSTPTPPANCDEIIAALDELNAGLAFPIFCQERLTGIVFLGEKQKDNVYTYDDLRLLGALISQLAIALDNTMLYEQMLESKRLYETILTHMQRGILAVDGHLQIRTLNHKGAEILGVSADEVLDHTVDDLALPFADILQRTLQERQNQPPVETSMRRPDGPFPCEYETSILLDGRNRVTGAMIVFQDLTERRQFEAEVRRMDRLASVGTLAAGIAHEIKNPLVSIQTFAQLLPERFSEEAFRDKFGVVVQSEITRINRLVHSLLDFARPRRCQRGPVDLHDLIDRALTLLDNETRKKHIDIRRSFDPNVPLVDGDAEQLYQVLFNLIQNAIQSMGKTDGTISLSTRLRPAAAGEEAPTVIVQVADTGSGIDKKDLPSIFDPFYSTKDEGSGLGLSICHSILEEHGARVDVESEIGQGTTFTIALPLPTSPRPTTAPIGSHDAGSLDCFGSQ